MGADSVPKKLGSVTAEDFTQLFKTKEYGAYPQTYTALKDCILIIALFSSTPAYGGFKCNTAGTVETIFSDTNGYYGNIGIFKVFYMHSGSSVTFGNADDSNRSTSLSYAAAFSILD